MSNEENNERKRLALVLEQSLPDMRDDLLNRPMGFVMWCAFVISAIFAPRKLVVVLTDELVKELIEWLRREER